MNVKLNGFIVKKNVNNIGKIYVPIVEIDF